ncbi:hypothetical protein FGG08_002287 [Glutinoglossum americanum]|uniref:Uncharacterized protein n=1 Tax=Glutinoglossum americanum TaxID=1670608 RepID=A0A9P8L4M4_9PEZI|nr:hypothetical protein FGG08_002287 [Glutinoglossum americanum]
MAKILVFQGADPTLEDDEDRMSAQLTTAGAKEKPSWDGASIVDFLGSVRRFRYNRLNRTEIQQAFMKAEHLEKRAELRTNGGARNVMELQKRSGLGSTELGSEGIWECRIHAANGQRIGREESAYAATAMVENFSATKPLKIEVRSALPAHEDFGRLKSKKNSSPGAERFLPTFLTRKVGGAAEGLDVVVATRGVSDFVLKVLGPHVVSQAPAANGGMGISQQDIHQKKVWTAEPAKIAAVVMQELPKSPDSTSGRNLLDSLQLRHPDLFSDSPQEADDQAPPTVNGFEIPSFPPIDTSRYQWQQSKTDPQQWQREVCGSEGPVGVDEIQARGEYNLFVGGSASLTMPTGITLNDIEASAKKVLRRFRHQRPEVALNLTRDEKDTCIIQYKPPKDEDEVHAWLQRCVQVEVGSHTNEDLRHALAGKQALDAVTLYVVGHAASISDPLENGFDFLFLLNHLYFDGISVKILAGRFFEQLAEELSCAKADKLETIDWASGVGNLPVPYVNLLAADQKISGPEFDKALKSHVKGLLDTMGNFGLNPSGPGTNSKPRSLFYTFDKDSSKAIISKIKTNLGSDFTVTHLAHAALVLATIEATLPAASIPDGQTFVSVSPINGREYLQEDYAKGRKEYLPMCQTLGIITWDNVKAYAFSEGASEAEKLEKLIAATKVAKEEWVANREKDHILPLSITLLDFVTAALKSQGHVKRSYPEFASDGITERYIARDYPPVFTVNDVKFNLNQYCSSPFIRLSSWRDCVRLSSDYNAYCYREDEMMMFLESVAGLMGLVAKM